jgi:hypothetical protein
MGSILLRHCARAAVPLALAAWLLAVGVGVRSLLLFAYTPGAAAAAPDTWPTSRDGFPAGGQSLLVMFVHPQCACSRASLSELAKLMVRADGRLTARVYLYLPGEMPAGWEQTDLWRAAAAIPGVSVTSDREGRFARAFHARVSGETQVYGPDRKLLFSGGITVARGHEGDSDGGRAILAYLADSSPTGVVRTPVFGCYLLASADAQALLQP